MSPRRCYAGIGARKMPAAWNVLCASIARDLEAQGYVLRSGGARGADRAFEDGVQDSRNKQIFTADGPISDAARELARRHHPAWHKVRGIARRLHARNGYQVLGPKLDDPCAFVVCWTPGAACVGGTAQALRIAAAYAVPVYNIADEEQLEKLRLERLQSSPIRATN